MNTLDALFARQVPSRGAGGADDAMRPAGQGGRIGRSQDGFAAALNGQAKGAREGGRNAPLKDDEDAVTLAIAVTPEQDVDPEAEADPDAYALLATLFAGIENAAAPSDAESETSVEPVDDEVSQELISVETAPKTPEDEIVVLADAKAQPVAGTKADAPPDEIETARPATVAAGAKPAADIAPERPVKGNPASAAAAVQAPVARPGARPAAASGDANAARTEVPRPRGPAGKGEALAPERQQASTGKPVDSLAGSVRTAARAASGEQVRGDEDKGGTPARASRIAASQSKDAGARSIENVRTIESRSFAAPAMSGNAEAVVRTLVQAGESADLKGMLAGLSGANASAPAAGANATLHLNRAQPLQTLKIQLNPVDLGQVTAVLRLTGEELSVELRVETAEAYRQLNNDSDAIVRSLRGQGYGVEQVTVLHFGADRSAMGGQGGQQTFSSGQQFQAGQGNTEAGGSNEGRRGNGDARANTQGDPGHEPAAPARSGTRSADGVYL